MKQQFRWQKITDYRMGLINMANDILEEYEDLGYRLTLRQLYYQLVARDFIPNKVQEYAKLSSTVVTGRMNGLIDWEMIEDRIRKPHLLYAVDSISKAIQDTINYYRLDRQQGQKFHIEIWTEKDAVSNILKKSAHYFHVKLMVNRGYSSCSAMYDAYSRMLAMDKPCAILYVGDHDPSGLDMLRDIRERLDEFGVPDFMVMPVALTMEQIHKYNPPPNPAKITDPRSKWYIEMFGNKSWELDALKPDDLDNIVFESVIKNLDKAQFSRMLTKEKTDKNKLKKMIEDLK